MPKNYDNRGTHEIIRLIQHYYRLDGAVNWRLDILTVDIICARQMNSTNRQSQLYRPVEQNSLQNSTSGKSSMCSVDHEQPCQEDSN